MSRGRVSGYSALKCAIAAVCQGTESIISAIMWNKRGFSTPCNLWCHTDVPLHRDGWRKCKNVTERAARIIFWWSDYIFQLWKLHYYNEALAPFIEQPSGCVVLCSLLKRCLSSLCWARFSITEFHWYVSILMLHNLKFPKIRQQ